MSGFEWNKIAASVFLAGLIAMVTASITDGLYRPEEEVKKRGYQVEVADNAAAGANAGGGAEEAPAAPVKIGQLMAKADSTAGKEQAKKCEACHSLDKGGANKVGPNLWGVIGAPKGHHAGYAYSDALKAKGGDWGYEDLYHFLNGPKKFIPGTKMGFAGFKKPEDIANTIAFLRTLSDSPVALPPAEK